MPAHSQFSPEVSNEITTISNYGGPAKARNRLISPDSYKAQALRELASRIWLENAREDDARRIAELVNRVESLELELDLLRNPAKSA